MLVPVAGRPTTLSHYLRIQKKKKEVKTVSFPAAVPPGASENAETEGLLGTQGLRSLIVRQIVLVHEINNSDMKQFKSSLPTVAVNVPSWSTTPCASVFVTPVRIFSCIGPPHVVLPNYMQVV